MQNRNQPCLIKNEIDALQKVKTGFDFGAYFGYNISTKVGDVMKDMAELIKEYGYITPEIAAKNVRLYSAYKQKTLNVIRKAAE